VAELRMLGACWRDLMLRVEQQKSYFRADLKERGAVIIKRKKQTSSKVGTTRIVVC